MPNHTLDVEIGRLVSGPILECMPQTTVSDTAMQMAARRCLLESRMRHIGVLSEQDTLIGPLGLSGPNRWPASPFLVQPKADQLSSARQGVHHFQTIAVFEVAFPCRIEGRPQI
ncbi:hypothetical protein B0G69_7857 [Paraburkholderia sp. RAU2J]|nr:hypothetical protein B0G69_7857 [Paraburkholderia sp. RAU2J]